MIRREGAGLRVSGPLTMETVPELAAGLAQFLDGGNVEIDFSEVTEVDSSAVALTLEWQRMAAGKKVSLGLRNLPDSMLNLSKLYGVSEFVQPN